ncbi:MAG: hypothetical protein IJC33_06490 [Clostridia bacterium]|nr:hypothetical protein [Clostridia bacterium]
MKKEELYEAIGDIQGHYVHEARCAVRKARPVWLKWAAMAACLCLVAVALAIMGDRPPSVGPEEVDPPYANTIAYVGWSEDPVICEGALNKELLQTEPSAHLPIFKMDTVEELERFISKYETVFTMNQGYDDRLSFEAAIAKAQWDREGFFNEHSLLMIYVPANSGSFRFGVQKVTVTDNSICVVAEQKNDPEIFTEDMAGWMILMEVEDEEIGKYTSFDAVLKPKRDR